jgi:hypothetical protein
VAGGQISFFFDFIALFFFFFFFFLEAQVGGHSECRGE